MTDRNAGYIVTLSEDIREDEDEAIITALRMVKGVASVTPVIADFEFHMAEERARTELRRAAFDAIDQVFKR